METSADMVGGVGVGFTGHIHGFNADAEARLDSMMMEVGKWVEKEAGYLMGHIKMSVTVDGKGITLNLTDLKIGVEHHDYLKPSKKADFNFMAAVVDVDKGELEHAMMHAMEDCGVYFHVDEHECACGHEHHHHHDHEHDHEHHDHEHHHEHGEECHCHDHEHHHHDHDHEHHHEHGEHCHCHDHE